MKNISLALLLLLSTAAVAQAPSKLFDVRNGNSIVDKGVEQPQAIYIVFRDASAKQAVIDAICDTGNYDSLDPATRLTKAAFANREIQFWLRDKVRSSRERTEAKKIVAPDVSDLP